MKNAKKQNIMAKMNFFIFHSAFCLF